MVLLNMINYIYYFDRITQLYFILFYLIYKLYINLYTCVLLCGYIICKHQNMSRVREIIHFSRALFFFSSSFYFLKL
jgi:hypothetical protein